MAFLFAATVIISSCTKETADVRLEPTLTTSQTLNISSNAATVVGFVVAEGDGFTEKGVCYGTATAPTTSDSKVVYSGESTTATFNVTLSNLNYATSYFARAYAISEAGTFYGVEVTFTTLPVVPFLTTTAITEITGSAAVSGGNVTGTGGADVTARGICFGMNENPTVSDSKTTDGDGLGEFISTLSGLSGNTNYYVRAYAVNSAGTGYGPEVTFTTLVDLPKVTTTAVTEITKTTAKSGGEITADGGAEITAKGLVWSTDADPTILNTIIDGGTGKDAFVSELTGLEKYTTYHVRAFATNSAGTSYGSDIEFTTLADITKLWIVGSYNGWDNSDNAMYIESTIASGADAEGYVYLTTDGLKLTLDHSWSDAATFGDDGTGKLTNGGNNISVAEDGYYLIKANLADMTYSLTKTEWGVIGSGSPLGWDDETALTYNPASLTWQGVMHLTAAEIKFRANHDWGYNYGSSTSDANLNDGGDNIPVSVESDYSISLDLSHPNAYTYSANRWGLIGDATPGGWDNDTNMTWDATNNVFTVTLDLISSGSFKFRANDGWDLNYGGDVNALSAGGDNITIASDGNYTVTFDPWGLTATVTQN